ncbi:MAG: hypothetical protein PVJ57_04985 [Phycisphaerae bacterium]|jgi:hypothetical protein
MSPTARLTASTLIPERDKWTACDGAEVVLRDGRDDLVLLSYSSGAWHVTRHASRTPGNGLAAMHESIAWRGAVYDGNGQPLLTLTESDPAGRWSALYREIVAVWTPDV